MSFTIAPWSYPLAAVLSFFGAGLLLLILVARRPDLFWPAMISAALATGGVFALGYSLMDDWLSGCLAAGACLAVRRGAVPRRDGGLRRPWVRLFLIWGVYLTLESLMGLVIYEDFRILRWVFFYGSITATAALIAGWRFPLLKPFDLQRLIAFSGVGYFLLYLLGGLIFNDVSFKWNREMFGPGGSGCAYACFPMVLIVPAAVVLMREGERSDAILGFSATALAAVVSVIGESRASLAALIAFLGLTIFTAGLRASLLAWTSVIPAYALMCLMFGSDYLLNQLPSGGKPLDPKSGDSERVLRVVGSVDILFSGRTAGSGLPDDLGDSWAKSSGHAAGGGFEGLPLYAPSPVERVLHFLVGYGTRGFQVVTQTELKHLRAKYKTRGAGDPWDIPRPTGWAGTVLETGAAGFLLAAASAGIAGWRIGFRGLRPSAALRPGIHWLFTLTVVLALGWGLIDDTRDIVLFYLLLMPFGVIDVLAGNPTAATREFRPPSPAFA